MLNMLSIAQLENLLDQFSVPMFLVERQETADEFRISTLNRAFEDLSGLPRQNIVGQSIVKLAAAAAAKDTVKYYSQCVTTRRPIRFTFLFSQDHSQSYWDNTLQYARSPEGHDRVIATAIKVPDVQPLLQDRLAFEDLRYYASIADLQLENLSSAFSAVTQMARVTPIEEERISRLNATCRTIQRTVSDIKKIVRTAQARHMPPDLRALEPDAAPDDQILQDRDLNTLRALEEAFQNADRLGIS
jgi:hypothetical protein